MNMIYRFSAMSASTWETLFLPYAHRHTESLQTGSAVCSRLCNILLKTDWWHLEVFYRTFKRIYGVTPAEFRTTHENSIMS